MSVYAERWAMSQEVGNSGAKFVLREVATYADEKGRAWPSQETLALALEMGVSTVRRHLAYLEEEKQLITRHERRRQNGSKTSDVIVLQGEPEDFAPQPLKSSGKKGTNRSNRADQTRQISEVTTDVVTSENAEKSEKPKPQQMLLQQYLAGEVYDGLQAKYKVTLSGQRMGRLIGQFKNLLEHSKNPPTEQEQEQIVERMIEEMPNFEGADPQTMLNKIRLEAAKAERTASTATPAWAQAALDANERLARVNKNVLGHDHDFTSDGPVPTRVWMRLGLSDRERSEYLGIIHSTIKNADPDAKRTMTLNGVEYEQVDGEWVEVGS